MKNKVIGIIPARLKASRFPGKPLAKIKGMPMIQHVFERAKMYRGWDQLFIATCDKEIIDFAKQKNYPYILTSKKHKRALDRVYEAASKIKNIKKNDIVLCVQADEPLVYPEMLENLVLKLIRNKVDGAVAAMQIIQKKQFLDPNIVKIIHKKNGEVLYTSRSPIPHNVRLNKDCHIAKRIHGMFSFRWHYLKKFYNTQESILEKVESCDSNRICEIYGGQYISYEKYKKTYSVDSKKDIKTVERLLSRDKLIQLYKDKNLI